MGYAIVTAAVVAAIGSVVNTWLQLRTRRDLQPPSGGTIGEAVERTEHASHIAAAGLTMLSREFHAERVARSTTPPEGIESQP